MSKKFIYIFCTVLLLTALLSLLSCSCEEESGAEVHSGSHHSDSTVDSSSRDTVGSSNITSNTDNGTQSSSDASTDTSATENPDTPPIGAGEFTVSFDSNGGTPVEAQIVKSHTKVSTPTVSTREGYTLEGWYVGEEKWSFIGFVVTENITLVAKWTPNKNTIIFDPNSGNGSMENMTISTNESSALPKNTYEKPGYTFIGWSTDKDGAVVYGDGATYTMGTADTYVLYAVWETNTNTVTFDANGGSGNMSEIKLSTGEKANLPKNSFSRSGYRFTGWSVTRDGEVEYIDGTMYEMGTESQYTLYAMWEAIKYTITYEMNGATPNSPLPKEFTIEDLPLKLVDPGNQKDRLFNFWHRKSDFSDSPVFEITEQGNVTLYAEYVDGSDGVYLTLKNGFYSVLGCKSTLETLIIPKSYKGIPVTKIDRDAFYCSPSLLSVVIPDSIDEIGVNAFCGCPLLTSVTIQEGLTEIPFSAFEACTSLATVTIPSSVTSIRSSAFALCSSLEKIVIPATVSRIDYYAFYSCSSLTIYCEAAEMPSAWSWGWNVNTDIPTPEDVTFCPVIWGYSEQ